MSCMRVSRGEFVVEAGLLGCEGGKLMICLLQGTLGGLLGGS